MRSVFVAFAVLWISGAIAAEPALTVNRHSDGAYEFIFVTDYTTDVAVAQQALLPAAREVCAGKTPRFGRYKFQTAEPIPGQVSKASTLTLNQIIHCDGVAESAAAKAPPAPRDDALIERLTRTYWAARDAAKYQEAYALFAPSMKQVSSLESLSGRVSSFNAEAGAMKERRIKKITWYDNPPSAPPGTYAAVDYESNFEKLRFHCGFIAWRIADGSAGLVREEENYITKADAAKMRPEQLRAVAQQFRCEVR